VSGSTGGLLTANLFAKLKEYFVHLDTDPDQDLQDLTLNSGDDLSAFAHKYVKIHKASTVPEKRAVLMLKQKVKHVPDLHQHMLQVYIRTCKSRA